MLRIIFPLVILCFAFSLAAAEREYWIAAEIVEWNYAPSGQNLIREQKGLGVWGDSLIYKKYRYVQYVDGSFKTRVPQPKWMGILGPQIRAEEGDTLKVHFLNRTDKPLSIHPHGVHYDEQNEGADMKGKGAYVKPGERFTYRWHADSGSAPGENDLSSIIWTYHSHVDPVTEIYDGLIGTIIVTKKGWARSAEDPRPKDVDVELTNLFMVFDENGREALDVPATYEVRSEEEEEEGHLKHSINGFIFGNLVGMDLIENQKVRWHLIGMGTEVDLHTVHWHGETVLQAGQRRDVIDLLPNTTATVDMRADNPGDWLYHCHVTDHITAGMVTRWRVRKKLNAP